MEKEESYKHIRSNHCWPAAWQKWQQDGKDCSLATSKSTDNPQLFRQSRIASERMVSHTGWAEGGLLDFGRLSTISTM
jgi:hypothetical protein